MRTLNISAMAIALTFGLASFANAEPLKNTTAQEGITFEQLERAKRYSGYNAPEQSGWDTHVGTNSPKPLFLAPQDRPGPQFEVAQKSAEKPVAVQVSDPTVNFAWDSANLTDEAKTVLDNFIHEANQAGVQKVAIEGYTDTSGPVLYNDKLGYDRANTVANYLEAKLDAEVAYVTSYGESNPAVETGDGVRNYKNRRAVVTVQ